METLFHKNDYIKASDLVRSVVNKWGNFYSFELVDRNGTLHMDVLPLIEDVYAETYMSGVAAVVMHLNEWGLGRKVIQRIAEVPDGIEPYKTGENILIPVSFDLAISSRFNIFKKNSEL